jgi:hypothetical protein
MSLRVIWQYMVRHQKNIIWTSEASVHVLPYDPQCHELFAISIKLNSIQFKILLPLIQQNCDKQLNKQKNISTQ